MRGQLQLQLPERTKVGRPSAVRRLWRRWEEAARREEAVKVVAARCEECADWWCDDCPLLVTCRNEAEREERMSEGWEPRIKAAKARTAAAFAPLIPYVKEWWTR